MEDVMIRISVLWIFTAITMTAHYALLFFEPDALKQDGAGSNTLLATGEAVVNWLIPMAVAFLSVTLEGAANRNMNLVFGGFYTFYSIAHVARCPIIHVSKKPSVYQLLVGISTVVVTALIFWYAWAW